MKIVLGQYFRLPRLGKDVFIKLMKLGVKYDKKHGFIFDDQTDVKSVVLLISDVLGEEVKLYTRCALEDDNVAPCDECLYKEDCDRKVVSFLCLCNDCYKSKDAFALYSSHLASLVE
jgi:hypothetical protein